MNLGGAVRVNKCALMAVVALLIFVCYVAYGGSEENSTLRFAHKNLNQISLRKLLIGSIQAAQMGGLEVVAISRRTDFGLKSKGHTKEGANDPVTEADFRSHCVIRNGMLRIFPKLKIISEEDGGGQTCLDHKLFDLNPTVLHESTKINDEVVDAQDITIYIDPLDATQEYTEKLFQYVTTMVCVVVRGEPVIGIIHNPFTGATTWAWTGQEARSENIQNVKRRPSAEEGSLSREQLKAPTFVVSRSHAGDVSNVSKAIFGEQAHVISAAGSGYKVLEVVHGNATAYLHTTAIKKWDICAGDAILRALGGKLTTLDKAVIDYSPDTGPVNSRGLLAALDNHELIMEKISNAKVTFGLLKQSQH